MLATVVSFAEHVNGSDSVTFPGCSCRASELTRGGDRVPLVALIFDDSRATPHRGKVVTQVNRRAPTVSPLGDGCPELPLSVGRKIRIRERLIDVRNLLLTRFLDHQHVRTVVRRSACWRFICR